MRRSAPVPGPAVYLRDIGDGRESAPTSSPATPTSTAGAPSTSRSPSASDASTLDVIQRVKAGAADDAQAVARRTSTIRLEFDQSRYVTSAPFASLVNEGLLGAVLTGLMVLLFLRDWRSALIVVTTIPFALLVAVVWLWAAGQTINIMTLGGLALAVGVLVDEATVEIENIHTHLAAGIAARARRARRLPQDRRPAPARDALHPRRVRARRSS